MNAHDHQKLTLEQVPEYDSESYSSSANKIAVLEASR